MHPAVYLLSPYYEHWIHTVEHYGKAKGLLDLDEVDRRTQYYLEHPDAPLPQREDPDLVAFIEAVVPAGAPAKRESDKAPQFKVGDTVTVRADSPIGHTRRARYIRGRTGEIVLAHGTFIYPDSAGNGGGDAPQHVYTVKFTNTELWGPDTAEPNGVVYFDVWEPYIVPAHTTGAAA
jgi:nitrile hydratase